MKNTPALGQGHTQSLPAHQRAKEASLRGTTFVLGRLLAHTAHLRRHAHATRVDLGSCNGLIPTGPTRAGYAYGRRFGPGSSGATFTRSWARTPCTRRTSLSVGVTPLLLPVIAVHI